MFTWGLVVWLGIAVILWDVNPVWKARLMGNPLMMHLIVIGSGLWIHGGSSQGAMAAIVSGVISAMYVHYQRRMNGYIKGSLWYPGLRQLNDPRTKVKT